ncbi:MAG: retroviral-like aspartic protease family protein [Gemmataceae bacterium]|nr:retroviral-like aspartic protease family protein [Gemmataceae bacterium]
MTEAFDPAARSVLVPVTVVGPRRHHTFRCALDTGSTHTVLPATYLRGLGYDLTRPAGRTRVRSATGLTAVPVIRVSAVVTLGRVRTDFLVAALDLPLGVGADGLLGLDFFRGLVVTLDFARGRVGLRPPRPWWRFW